MFHGHSRKSRSIWDFCKRGRMRNTWDGISFSEWDHDFASFCQILAIGKGDQTAGYYPGWLYLSFDLGLSWTASGFDGTWGCKHVAVSEDGGWMVTGGVTWCWPSMCQLMSIGKMKMKKKKKKMMMMMMMMMIDVMVDLCWSDIISNYKIL